MKAVEATESGSSDVLEVVDRPVPEPDRDEVRIDVDAVGVNFADVEKRRGRYPDGPEPPYVPGMEAAGRVDAIGPGVDYQVGDRVVAFVDGGAYAERAIAPTDRLFDVPDSMESTAAAGFPVHFLTAHHALDAVGGLEPDDRVLIHAAAGGVGTAAVQLAAAAGAEVFGTASTAAKLDLARDLGAGHAVNYEEADLVEEIEDRTNGRGVDLVLDGVGGDAFYDGLEVLAGFGRIVTYGVASGSVPAVSTPRLLFENKSVRGFHLGHAFAHRPDETAAVALDLLERLDTDELDVIVEDTFSLGDAAAAHDHLENRASVGKVVLEP